MNAKIEFGRRTSRFVCLAGILLVGVSVTHAEGTFISAPNRVDIAYDDAQGILYISNANELMRYQLSTQQFLPSIPIAGMLAGMDISPDGQHLAVADTSLHGSNPLIHIVDLNDLTVQNVSFPPAFYEGGTYTVAYGSDGKILVTSTFQGSGWVPLRRYAPRTGTTTELASVRQNTMLSASADRSVIAFAEANISDGPFGRYRVSDGDLLRKSGYNDGTSWFNYEIAVNSDGSQYAIPTYGGTFITDGDLVKQPTIIGTYAGPQPVGAVYDPVHARVYFAWASTTEVKVFDSNTLTELWHYDFESFFGGHGNGAFINGRMKISKNGDLLFATVDGGVRYVQTISADPVNDPPSFSLAKTSYVVALGGLQRTYKAAVTDISPGPFNESSQIVSFALSNNNPGLFAEQPAIASNGTLTFRPKLNKTGKATVTVIAVDDGGTTSGGINSSAPKVLTLTVGLRN